MAKNYRQMHAQVISNKIAALATALEERSAAPVPDDRDPEMHELVSEGMRTQIADLEAELERVANSGHYKWADIVSMRAEINALKSD